MFIQPSFKKHRDRVALSSFCFGVVTGVLAASFLRWLFISSNHNNNSAPTTTTTSSFLSLTREFSKSSSTSRNNNYYNDDGWKLIHVYYGNTSHIEDASAIRKNELEHSHWFSQLDEDLKVSSLLREKRNGYFVDIGASDAIRMSNTYALEKYYGWTGLCLEPNHVYWASLTYRHCHVAGAVVGNQTMQQVTFQFPVRKSREGGIVGAEFSFREPSQYDGEDQHRFTVTLSDIFQRFRTPNIIDYVSLDVEGAEDYIMKSFPFSNYQFNVLSVERPSDAFCQLLQRHGYVMLPPTTRKWGGETLWIHRSIESDIDKSILQTNDSSTSD